MNVPKWFVVMLVTLGQGLITVLTDQSIPQWINFGIYVCTGVTMYIVPNLNATVSKYSKAFVSGIAAVLTLLVTLLPDGHLTTPEMAMLILAFVQAVGVPVAAAPQHPIAA